MPHATDEDTDVDGLVPKRRRVRIPDADDGAGDSGECRTNTAPRGARPPSMSVRLRHGRPGEVQLRETILRRAVTGEESTRDETGDARDIDIAFLRSTDPTQTIRRMGQHVVIEGYATGTTRAGSSGQVRPSTIAIALDGVIFAVRVEAEDSARVSAERLAARLSECHVVTTVEGCDERVLLCVTRSRLSMRSRMRG